ncbi:MAG TPA: cob(I)yrinic acid a,c-diamide adenosyltransferase [Candidatus Magasanikbacteria bacterium]|nr:MAG: ATP:cob(I)alamin adenosyltransferase [Candidatus Magasanikbacteria bacterium RIFOXYC2_FULL_39_8]HAT04059.1 cob(I)yrinic acid a,c-diamide adenosyltransferase [Candidatus Magasanikbacteria bacterium]
MPKLYTKTGDKGDTSLLGGKRVRKSCIEMGAIGEIDELNSSLGVLIAELREEKMAKNAVSKLIAIQRKLFTIGAQVASVQTTLTKVPRLSRRDVSVLEKWVDTMDTKLPRLTAFILPGGTEEAALAFHARAICRRAERNLVKLSDHYDLPIVLIQYLNRLSDALFALGRWINKKEGMKELKWKK